MATKRSFYASRRKPNSTTDYIKPSWPASSLYNGGFVRVWNDGISFHFAGPLSASRLIELFTTIWLTFQVKQVYCPLLVLRSNDKCSASSDEPARSSYGGHLHPESLARISSPALVHESPLFGREFPMSGKREFGSKTIRTDETTRRRSFWQEHGRSLPIQRIVTGRAGQRNEGTYRTTQFGRVGFNLSMKF